MIQLPTLCLTASFFTLVLATDPRLLDRNVDRILRRADDSDLEFMECGQLLPDPSPTAVPPQSGVQLVECRHPLQQVSIDAAASKTSGDELQPDPNAPSLRTSSTFSKTTNNRTDSDDFLFALRFPPEHASSIFSKTSDDYFDLNPDQQNPSPSRFSDDRPLNPYNYDDDDLLPDPDQRISIPSKSSDDRPSYPYDYNDDDLVPDPDAPSLRSSSSYSNPSEDDLPGASQSQSQQPYYSTLFNSTKQPFGSEIEFTSSPRLGHSNLRSTAPEQFGSEIEFTTSPRLGHSSSSAQLNAPQQECMQCAEECAGPGASPQQVVTETCPDGRGTRQSDLCSGKRRTVCTVSAVTCCAFLTTFFSVYTQT